MKIIILKLAVSIGVLAIIFYFVPVTDVYAVIVQAGAVWLCVGIVLQIMLRVVTALRMRMIARAQHVNAGIITMLRIVFTSTFYNIVAPGALAGGAMTYLKYRQHGVKPVAAIANIYTNKSVEVLVVALSAPLFWLIDRTYSLPLILAYVTVMVVVFMFAFAFFFGRFENLAWLEKRINRHGQTTVHKALAALCRQLEQIGGMSHIAVISLVLYTVLYCLLVAMAIMCFGRALGLDVGLYTILWIYPVIYLLGLLPVTMSNIGVREASMIILLAPYGVTTAQAMAWSMLMYSGPLCSAFIGLLLEAEQFWIRKHNHQQTGTGLDRKPGSTQERAAGRYE